MIRRLIAAIAASYALLPFLPARAAEQAVIVHFRYGLTDMAPLFALEDRLKSVIQTSKLGEFDGDEIAVDRSDGRLYMYGPSADQLFDAIQPILKTSNFMNGAEVKRRYGPANSGAREVSTTLSIDLKP
jgi:hypothetical protein